MTMKKLLTITAASLLWAGFLVSETTQTGSPFLEKPYLQLGNTPKSSSIESLVVMWHTNDAPADWSVEIHGSKDSKWRAAERPSATPVSAPAGPPAIAGKDGAKRDVPPSAAIERHLVYRAKLTGL